MPTASFKRLKEWSWHFLRNDFKLEIGIENTFKKSIHNSFIVIKFEKKNMLIELRRHFCKRTRLRQSVSWLSEGEYTMFQATREWTRATVSETVLYHARAALTALRVSLYYWMFPFHLKCEIWDIRIKRYNKIGRKMGKLNFRVKANYE